MAHPSRTQELLKENPAALRIIGYEEKEMIAMSKEIRFYGDLAR